MEVYEGLRFGSLLVIANNGSFKVWDCRCDCGTVKTVKEYKLTSGHTKSCGCSRKVAALKASKQAIIVNRTLQVGQVFGRLTLISVYPTRAICACGKEVVINFTCCLTSGDTLSCGCLKKEYAKEKGIARLKAYRLSKGLNPDVAMLSENKQLRNKFKQVIVKQVFERDNYTCLLCGNRGVKLHAHHICKWSDAPNLRFDLNNLATLCVSCHIPIAHKGNVFGEVCTDTATYLQRIIKEKTC